MKKKFEKPIIIITNFNDDILTSGDINPSGAIDIEGILWGFLWEDQSN